MELGIDKEYPPVRIDLMRAAMTAFYAAMQRKQAQELPWSKDAWNAVFEAVRADRQNSIAYLQRCHAFRLMTKAGVPKALERWLVPTEDGKRVELQQVLIDAVALAPLRRDGKFRIKEFAATVEKIESETTLSTETAST